MSDSHSPQEATKQSRRDFLKAAGLASLGALAAAGGCHRLQTGWPAKYHKDRPPAPGERHWKDGESIMVKTICRQCPAGCGIKVKVEKGRVVQVQGLDGYPVNSGGIGPKGQASPQTLYDPYRVEAPLKKTKEGKWKKIDWKTALAEISGKLSEIRKKGPEKLVILNGNRETVVADLWQRFARAYGTPNYVFSDTSESSAIQQAMKHSLGKEEIPVVDWENSQYVLSFGAALYDSHCQLVHLTEGLRKMRFGRKTGRRGSLVHFDTQFSTTASEANSWHAVRPGTYGLVAMGLARIIVDKKWHHQDFIKEKTKGFDKFLKVLQKEEYSPQKVSEKSGLSAKQLEYIARDFATSRPGVAIGDARTTDTEKGYFTASAIYALNALVGSWGVKGGITFGQKSPFADWPAPELDQSATEGLKKPRADRAGTRDFPLATYSMRGLLETIEKGEPYRPEGIFFYYTNPVYSHASGLHWKEALEKIPFKVSFSPYLDDTAEICDYILPDDTFLERWDLHTGYSHSLHPVAGLQRPVILDIRGWRDLLLRIPTYKLFDTKNTGTLIIELARDMGGSLKKAFSGKDPEDMYYLFDDMYEKGFDEVLIPGIQGAMWSKARGLMKAERGNINKAAFFDEFKEKLFKEGGWWDTNYNWKKAYEDIQYNFFSTSLKEKLESYLPSKGDKDTEKKDFEKLLDHWKIKARGEEVFLPHYEEPDFAGSPQEFPHYLFAYKPMTYAYGSGANQPWLQDVESRVNRSWGSWLEINPQTASNLNLKEGDQAILVSPAGKSPPLKVALYAGLPPDMVAMEKGKGHQGRSKFAQRGYNINRSLVPLVDSLVGSESTFGTRVRIEKVKGDGQ